MTTQYSKSRAISGQTGTSLKLFAINGDTVLYTADTVVERTNAKGEYLGTFGETAVIPAGNYTQIHFSSGGIPLSIGDRTFLGTDGETATERAAVLDPAALDPVLEAIAALESASATWTDAEKAQIRYRLGLDGTATAPAEPVVDPIVITPATGIMTTGYLVTRVKGVPTAGITIRYQQAQEPASDRGSSYDDTIYSATSNSEGIAELSLVKGGLYYVWRSLANRPMNVAAYRVLKADGTTPDATLALPSHVGA